MVETEEEEDEIIEGEVMTENLHRENRQINHHHHHQGDNNRNHHHQGDNNHNHHHQGDNNHNHHHQGENFLKEDVMGIKREVVHLEDLIEVLAEATNQEEMTEVNVMVIEDLIKIIVEEMEVFLKQFLGMNVEFMTQDVEVIKVH